MDKTAKKVYKHLLAHQRDVIVSFDDAPDGMSIVEYHDALLSLCKNGYVYLTYSSVSQDEAMIGIKPRILYSRLTHEGRHKRELEIEAFWRGFFTRFIPGLVSGLAIEAGAIAISLLVNYLIR